MKTMQRGALRAMSILFATITFSVCATGGGKPTPVTLTDAERSAIADNMAAVPADTLAKDTGNAAASEKSNQTAPDLNTALAAVKKEVKPGEGKPEQKAALSALREATEKLNKEKQSQVNLSAAGSAFTHFQAIGMNTDTGGVTVTAQKTNLRRGAGGQFALALEAYDIATQQLVARSELYRINSSHDNAFVRGVLTLKLSAGELKNANGSTTFSLVSYFSPNRRDNWQMTNYVPVGRANVSGGRASDVDPYLSSMLTGRTFLFSKIEFGAGERTILTFAFNSQNNCLEYNERMLASGFGMNLASDLTGCLAFSGNQMVYSDQKFCNQQGCGRVDKRRVMPFQLTGGGFIRAEGGSAGTRQYRDVGVSVVE